MAEIGELHRVARVSRYRLQTKRRLSIGFALLVVGAFLATSVLGSLALRYAMPQSQPVTQVAKGPEIVSVTLPLCHGGKGRDCVIDGDTFRLGGQSIRIADIDTPETRDFGCDAEKALGDRATARMQQLLNAGRFELQPYARDEDQYGRKLRIVTRDGQSLGQILVSEGLARNWDGARHPWC